MEILKWNKIKRTWIWWVFTYPKQVQVQNVELSVAKSLLLMGPEIKKHLGRNYEFIILTNFTINLFHIILSNRKSRITPQTFNTFLKAAPYSNIWLQFLATISKFSETDSILLIYEQKLKYVKSNKLTLSAFNLIANRFRKSSTLVKWLQFTFRSDIFEILIWSCFVINKLRSEILSTILRKRKEHFCVNLFWK